MPRDVDGRKKLTPTEEQALEMIEKGMTATEALTKLERLTPELDSMKQALLIVAKIRLGSLRITDGMEERLRQFEDRFVEAFDEGRPVVLSQAHARNLWTILDRAVRAHREAENPEIQEALNGRVGQRG